LDWELRSWQLRPFGGGVKSREFSCDHWSWRISVAMIR
jgi:hypothetical protein